MMTTRTMKNRVDAGFDYIKSRLYFVCQRTLSQGRRDQIKRYLSVQRKEWKRLYLLMHRTYTSKELIDEIRRRVDGDFEILMVHSAYDRLLPMYAGTARELLQELLDFCGTERTLVMPSFVLGGRAGTPCEYYKTHSFDVRRTPSEMGLLTELFRRTPGVRRSLHPSHSIVALGPLAEMLTSKHHLAATPSGRRTPFETMAQRRTIIIGLGIEYYRCLTQIHAAEDLSGSDFPVEFQHEHVPATLINADGDKLIYDLAVRSSHHEMDFRRVRTLLSKDELQEWRFRGTPMFLTFADQLTNRLVQAAKQGITVYRSA